MPKGTTHWKWVKKVVQMYVTKSVEEHSIACVYIHTSNPYPFHKVNLKPSFNSTKLNIKGTRITNHSTLKFISEIVRPTQLRPIFIYKKLQKNKPIYMYVHGSYLILIHRDELLKNCNIISFFFLNLCNESAGSYCSFLFFL